MKVKKEDLHESGRPLTQSEFIERIKNDEDFSKRFGELGPIYGSGWRNFEGVDQITELINELKVNPDSRRLKVSAWQPHKVKDMVLPPCHTDFQLYTRELSDEERLDWMKKNRPYDVPKRAISLMWSQRSVNEKSAA